MGLWVERWRLQTLHLCCGILVLGVCCSVVEASDCPMALHHPSSVHPNICNKFETDPETGGPAGYCDRSRTCQCSGKYAGEACNQITKVSAPSGHNDAITMNGWQFLGKSCWRPSSSGILKIHVNYSRIECNSFRCTVDNPAEQEDWEGQLPLVLLYTSSTDGFNDALTESYRTRLRDDVPQFCSAANSTMSMPFRSYMAQTNPKLGEAPRMQLNFYKSLEVHNPMERDIVVYLAISGCNMRGVVSWSMETDIKEATVCASEGGAFADQCLQNVGDTCALQSEYALVTHWEVEKKISRLTMAILCGAVVGLLVLGVFGLKKFQAEHKLRHAKNSEMEIRRQLQARGEQAAANYQPQGNTIHKTSVENTDETAVGINSPSMAFASFFGKSRSSGHTIHHTKVPSPMNSAGRASSEEGSVE